MDGLRKLFNELSSKSIKNYGSDFLLTWDKSKSQLDATLTVAEIFQLLREQKLTTKVFESGLAVSWFRDKSTRTRFSFKSAANLLGLETIDIDEEKSQIAHGETVRETANMISFLTEVIGIRDDVFLGEGHCFQKEVATAVKFGYKRGILPQRPAVINLQCDYDHPTQSMADLLHLKNYFGSLSNLKGKKIAISWAYSPSYGKPLSVPQGVINLLTRFGMDVTLAYPDDYHLIPELEKKAQRFAKKEKGVFRIVHNMAEAFRGADVVYPKSWAPYKIMQERTKLLRSGDDIEGLKELEKTALFENFKHKDWECNEKMMKMTNKGRALYLHCLPADVSGVSCQMGEVSKGVFTKFLGQTFRQAGYKPYIIASMIFLSRFKKPSEVLGNLNKIDWGRR